MNMARLSCLPWLDNTGEGGKTFIKRLLIAEIDYTFCGRKIH
ncbi:hypothetical protein KIS1582_1921 [Cytobacillus firmus]|uniref:Uncharacterized protein n=1 Tax=Cytobacillus firmus TaxID=1399 RepID=A0A800NAT7_CYTFI|nr:hypothetical protein KIS1582_1921 [Cytobacillus firmus]